VADRGAVVEGPEAGASVPGLHGPLSLLLEPAALEIGVPPFTLVKPIYYVTSTQACTVPWLCTTPCNCHSFKPKP
jgi:hypothetical protein